MRLPLLGTRKAQRRLYQAAALATLAFFAPITAVHAYSAPYQRTAATVPYEPVAVVFGAAEYAGNPTPYLARRLDVALDLYRRGKVTVILVTGATAPGYDEPTAMRKYLLARGVPNARIVRDFAGLDTWESCVRAKKIFGVDRATLVTQDFHLPRALMLCHSAGIDAYGVADTGAGAAGSRSCCTTPAARCSPASRRWASRCSSPTRVSWARRRPG
ncbi:vancomycin high temperature exclusion protein [Catenulispora yoronensis]